MADARRVPLPELGPIAALSPAHVSAFAARGHTVVRGLASPDEIAAFRPAIEAAVRSVAPRFGDIDERDTRGRWLDDLRRRQPSASSHG